MQMHPEEKDKVFRIGEKPVPLMANDILTYINIIYKTS